MAHLQHLGRIDIFKRAHGSKMTIVRCIAMEIESRDESADNPSMLLQEWDTWHRTAPVARIASGTALMVTVPQPVEIRYAVFVTGHGLAIEDHRTRAQPNQRLNDQWKAMSQVIS